MNLFSINPQGDVEYGSEGSLEVHNSIVDGDLEKAIRLSKGDGGRVSGGVRGEPQHLHIPSPLNLNKAHYLMNKMTYQGLNISIENSAGSFREGVDHDGHPWRSLIHFDYGYIKGTMAPDGDHVDCFIGPYSDAKNVFVIHQKNVKTGKFDEDKVMLGWKRKRDARRDYLKNYDRSDQIMGISTMSMAEFKKKLPGTNDKPIMIKSTIRTHQRHTKGGKTVMVRQHQDTRTKKDKPTKKGGSFIKVGAVPTGSIKIPGTKITNVSQIAAIFKGMKDDAREKFWVVGADKNDNIVSVELHSMGGISSSTVDSKVILGVLRANGAKKFWGIHNHPAGGTSASRDDIVSMKRIGKIAAEVGIEHQNDVIIHGGKDTYTVFGPADQFEGDQEKDEKGWVEHPVTELKVTSRKKAEEGMPTKVTNGGQVAQLGHWIQSKHGQGVWGVTLNTQNEITGYYLMGDNKMSIKAQQDKYAKALLKHMLDTGATNSVMVGTSFGASEVDKFNTAMNEYLSPKGYTYLDSVFETSQGFYSAAGTSFHQVAKSFVMMIKSQVKAHTRRTSTGKIVHVKAHEDIRSKKATQKVVRDVGEKIGGAKKELWKDLANTSITRELLAEMEKTPEDAHKHITKKKLLLEMPSDDEAKANGVDPMAQYMLKQVVRNVPERPGDTPEERENFIIVMKRINGLIRNAKSPYDVFGFIREEADQMTANINKHISNVRSQIIDIVLGNRPDKMEWIEKLSIRERKERYKQSPFMVIAREAAMKVLSVSAHAKRQIGYGLPTEEEQMSRAKEALTEMKTGTKMTKVSDSLLLGQKWLHFVLAGLSVTPNTDEDTTERAERFRIMQSLRKYDATRSGAHDLGHKMFMGMKNYDYDKVKETVPTGKGGFERDVLEDVEREGGAMIDAKKPEDLMKQFGIRGVEFGNYMDETSGEYHVQHSGEALLDLANILGLPKESMSLSGRLALAFGSRGSGKFAAHYEPLKEVINMTKWRGGGSLAHEWAHFLDNILAEKVTGSKTDFSSGALRGVPESIRDEYIEVMRVIHQGDGTGNVIKREVPISAGNNLKNRYLVVDQALETMLPHGAHKEPEKVQQLDASKVYDKTVEILGKSAYRGSLGDRNTMMRVASHIARRTKQSFVIEVESKIRGTQFAHDSKTLGQYWAKPHELFARAFESYVEDKLQSKKMKNTYLVSGTSSEKTKYTKMSGGVPVVYNPYPAGADRVAINAAMEKLVTKIRGNQSLLKSIMMMFLGRIKPMNKAVTISNPSRTVLPSAALLPKSLKMPVQSRNGQTYG